MPENEATEGVLAKRHSARSIINEADYTLWTGTGKAALTAGASLHLRTMISEPDPWGERRVYRQWFTKSGPMGEPTSPRYEMFSARDMRLPPSLQEIAHEEDRWIKSCRLSDAPTYEDYVFHALAWSAARAEMRRIINANPASPLPGFFGDRYRKSERYAEVYYCYLLSTESHDREALALNGFTPNSDFGSLPCKAGFEKGEPTW